MASPPAYVANYYHQTAVPQAALARSPSPRRPAAAAADAADAAEAAGGAGGAGGGADYRSGLSAAAWRAFASDAGLEALLESHAEEEEEQQQHGGVAAIHTQAAAASAPPRPSSPFHALSRDHPPPPPPTRDSLPTHITAPGASVARGRGAARGAAGRLCLPRGGTSPLPRGVRAGNLAAISPRSRHGRATVAPLSRHFVCSASSCLPPTSSPSTHAPSSSSSLCHRRRCF